MKRLLCLLTALGALTLPLTTQAASQVKLKFIGVIYTDTEGVALRNPVGVTAGTDKVYVADSGGKRVLSFTLSEGKVTPDQVLPLPQMYPMMVQPVGNGDLYVLDGRERQIAILGANGQIKGNFKPKGLPGSQQMVPRSIQKTPDGSLLVLDVFSERVLIFDEQGQFARQIGFPAEYGSFADVTMDRGGNVYLLDSVQAQVLVARSGAEEFEALTSGMEGNMNFPASIATDNRGTLFLVDKHGSGLAILGIDGSFAGRRLSMGWSEGQLYYPNQVSINEAGDLFIADTKNHRIQHFSIAE